MDPMAVALIVAAAIGLAAVILIARRQRLDATPPESPFAVSTEGETRCPKCGMGNLVTDDRCVACGSPLSR
jgi:hypothetical protein